MKRALEKENPAADLKVSPAVVERELCTCYLMWCMGQAGSCRVLSGMESRCLTKNRGINCGEDTVIRLSSRLWEMSVLTPL